MTGKFGKKSRINSKLIPFDLLEIEGDFQGNNENRCPICKKNIEGERKFCLGCGLKLSVSKEADKEKIIDYFNEIQEIMERSRQSIEKNRIRAKLRSIDNKIRKQPMNEELWFQKGIILNCLEADEKALVALNAVLDINSNHKKAWIAKAFVLTRLNRFRDASNCYRKALEIVLKARSQKGKRELEDARGSLRDILLPNFQGDLPTSRLKEVISGLREIKNIEGAALIEGMDTIIASDLPKEKIIEASIPDIMAEFKELDSLIQNVQGDNLFPQCFLDYNGYKMLAKKCKNDLTLLVMLRDRGYISLTMFDIESSIKKIDRIMQGKTTKILQ